MDAQEPKLIRFFLPDAEISTRSDGEVRKTYGYCGAVALTALEREMFHELRERAVQLAVLIPIFRSPEHAAVRVRKGAQKSPLKQCWL